jgi:hypothetical protein
MSQMEHKPTGKSDDWKWIELVIQQVNSLSFGVVEVVVHDGRVIQIEKTERLRLDKKSAVQQRTDRTR